MTKLIGFIITSLSKNKKLCSYGTTPIIDEEFNKVLTSPNWGNLKKITLEADNVMFYIVVDEKRAYAVITEKDYSSMKVYDKFLPELIEYVDGIVIENINASQHKKWFADLLNKYNDTKIDMISKQVADLNTTMTQNIQNTLHRGDRLTNLEDRVQDLNSQSQQFQDGSKKLSRSMMCRNWKLTGMISAVVIIVLTIVILALVL